MLVPLPQAADVLAFLGWDADDALTAQATVHVQNVTVTARAYTRSVGFSPDGMKVDDAIRAAIISACARSLSNPTQSKRLEAGAYNEAPGSFAGWSLAEIQTLNGFRRRVA